MNISFIQAIIYLNQVNSNLLKLCKTKEDVIIQYLLFYYVIRSLEDKMKRIEYIEEEDLKQEFANRLSSSSEHNFIKNALNENGENSIKENYFQLMHDKKTK